MLLGGIEVGGTKMVCGIADENGKLLDRMTIPTTVPEQNIPQIAAYFKEHKIDALGIGSFGPLDLQPQSPNYGSITRTPKPGWDFVNFLQEFQQLLHIPVGIDTDVNAAILGEVRFGAAEGLDSAIYITIGTGIGVGVYANGRLLHGLSHPEAGHMMLIKHPEDTYEGCCRFHKACFEGLASGPALQKRWGKPAAELYKMPKVWEIESFYIAQAITNYILCYAPQKIVLWGGVMHNEELFDLVRQQVYSNINGYVELPENYIIPPALGENPGVIGATQLGYDALLNV